MTYQDHKEDLRLGFVGYEKIGHIFVGFGKPWHCINCGILYSDIVQLNKWPDCKETDRPVQAIKGE